MSSVLLERLMSSAVRWRGGYAPSQMKTSVNTQLFLPCLPCSRIEPCRNPGLLFLCPWADSARASTPWSRQRGVGGWGGGRGEKKPQTTPGKQRLNPILLVHSPSRAQLHATPPTAKLRWTTVPFKWRAPAPQKNITSAERGERHETRKHAWPPLIKHGVIA